MKSKHDKMENLKQKERNKRVFKKKNGKKIEIDASDYKMFK
jgi:hypothetical protein